MSNFENGNLQGLFQNARHGVEIYQKNKSYGALQTVIPIQNLVEAHPTASEHDKRIIADTTLQHLATLQSEGLDDYNCFILARNLGHTLDKANRTASNQATSEFSATLAERGLRSFLKLAHAKAIQQGENPEEFMFDELAAARVQATGAMGALFTKTYEDAKPLRRISLPRQ